MKFVLRIAAKMLDGENGDPSSLNSKLVEELKKIDTLCGKVSGSFYSRQAIAIAIVSWQCRNPKEVAYANQNTPSR